MVKKSNTIVIWGFRIGLMLVLAVSLGTSCNEEGDLWMVYKETQCADPWATLDEPNTSEKVIRYLSDMGIKVYQIKIVQYSEGPFCLACSCPSGNDIKVRVSREDKEVLIDQGFE